MTWPWLVLFVAATVWGNICAGFGSIHLAATRWHSQHPDEEPLVPLEAVITAFHYALSPVETNK